MYLSLLMNIIPVKINMKPLIRLCILSLLCFQCNYYFSQASISKQLFFEPDSFIFSSDQQTALKALLAYLDTVKIIKVSINGFCDDLSSFGHNQILSLNRANYTKQFMLENSSLKREVIETKGLGEIPLTNNKQTVTEQRTQNRRVDVLIEYLLNPKPDSAKQEAATVKKYETKLLDNRKVGDRITLENILFYGGRHVLLPESIDELEMLTATLLEKKEYSILILGHICCVHDGKDGIDYDTGLRNLSVARAAAIYNYLTDHGIEPKRLSYKGMKADYPTGNGDKYDRRVEIEITGILGK